MRPFRRSLALTLVRVPSSAWIGPTRSLRPGRKPGAGGPGSVPVARPWRWAMGACAVLVLLRWPWMANGLSPSAWAAADQLAARGPASASAVDPATAAEPLSAQASVSELAPRSAAHSDDSQELPLADAGVAALRQALAQGSLSPEQLLHRSLQRVKALDSAGPRLNSLIAVEPHAAPSPRSLTGRSDQSGGVADERWLWGIPVVVGDTIDVQGLPTTAGTATLRGHRPQLDAEAVAALREAGAVLFAKGNSRELGLLSSPPGYSSAGGQTLNPYSSGRAASGVAAAIAAGLAPIGIGSDGAGDLRSAAAQTGLVAIRPTQGAVSLVGALPAPMSMDVIGPLARSVEDAALVLALLLGNAGEHPRGLSPQALQTSAAVVDGADAAADTDSEAEPAASPINGQFAGVRLGVFDALAGGHPEVDETFDQALQRLEAEGATLISLELPLGFESDWLHWRELLRETELRDQLNAYLAQAEAGRPNSLETLLRMSESPLIQGSQAPVDPSALVALGRASAGPGLASPEYLHTLSVSLPGLRQELLALLGGHRLDALVFPTALCPAPSRLDDYDISYDCDAADPDLPGGLASASGLPEITLPMGHTLRGLPLALSLLGASGSEAALIELAARFEQLRGAPPWPELLPRCLPAVAAD